MEEECHAPELDPQRQEKAREYARIRRRLWALGLLLSGLYLALWLAFGWHLVLRQALAAFPWWVTLLLIALALGLPYSVLTLPLDYYRGFVLPHRYGLSTQTLRGWVVDQIKGAAVSAAIGAPLLLALYATMRLAPDTWWLWAGGVFALFSVVLSALAPVLLMPIFYKFKPLAEDYADLVERLTRLAERAGAHVEGVFQFDMSRRTRAANAALTGLGGTRRIVLGDTLLEAFTPEEIETVLAHELGHHVHRDLAFFLVVQSAFTFLAFYLVSAALRALLDPLGLSGPADPAGLPALGLLFGLIGLVTMPLVNALSRWRERMADAFAVEVTGNPDAFASAMTRLANQNLAQVDPERWEVLLLYSHPPLRERIERARALAEKM